MKNALILAIALTPFLASAQGSTGSDQNASKSRSTLISVTARGTDVRSLVADIFSQAKLNYVLEPGITFVLFLNLDKVEFDEALNIVCTQAQLHFQVQNGIYFISKKPTVAADIPKPIPHGTLGQYALERRVTTKLVKTDIRQVFAEFERQTTSKIEVDPSVPNFKLDASLKHTTLRYALDKVTNATGLRYALTDHLTIRIYKPDDGNKIAVSSG